jgi:prepilin-type N-terminal cleavage/methylation domain-containing protein/prepilin-type processing-associated H-X9-DG protein
MHPLHGQLSDGGCRAGRSCPSAGFTLLELLVVIALIAVLAALFLPALGQAKARARQIECLSEMKQWQLAFSMFVNDNEGWIPRESYEINGRTEWNTWPQVRVTQDAWYNALSNHVNRPPASAYGLPSKRSGFYQRRSFFHCPSARFPSEASDPAYQIALFSRAMNSQLITPVTVALYQKATIPFDRIKYPSRTVLFLDNLLKGEEKVVPQQEESYPGQPSAYADRFAGRRHMRGGNLGFADGSGAWFRGEKVVETQGPEIGKAIVPPKDVVWDLDPD